MSEREEWANGTTEGNGKRKSEGVARHSKTARTHAHTHTHTYKVTLRWDIYSHEWKRSKNGRMEQPKAMEYGRRKASPEVLKPHPHARAHTHTYIKWRYQNLHIPRKQTCQISCILMALVKHQYQKFQYLSYWEEIVG